MIDIYTLVLGGIVAIMFLIVLCAILSMIIAFHSDNPPRKHSQVSFHKHRDDGRNVRCGFISQERVPGGV